MKSGRLHRLSLLGILAAGMLAAPLMAEEVSSDTLAQLRAELAAQQKLIDGLEQQVAASAQQGMDAQRTASMKQQIREVLSEREFRESLMPSTLQAGYDNGFFIRSSDDKFKMKFNGLIQFRWTYYEAAAENRYLVPNIRRSDRTGFDRSAYPFPRQWSCLHQGPDLLDGNGHEPGVGNYDAAPQYAWVNYRFMDEFQVKAGIFRPGGTRADVESTATMQFVEYPVINSVFGLGNGTGVRFWGELMEGKGMYTLTSSTRSIPRGRAPSRTTKRCTRRVTTTTRR
jgi:hypothetical protein